MVRAAAMMAGVLEVLALIWAGCVALLVVLLLAVTAAQAITARLERRRDDRPASCG